MPLVESYDVRKQFESGVVILSLDTEQIWGYLDQMNEAQFRIRYPDAVGAQEKVLACLSRAGVSATWFIVGGMALRGSDGARDGRKAAGTRHPLLSGPHRNARLPTRTNASREGGAPSR